MSVRFHYQFPSFSLKNSSAIKKWLHAVAKAEGYSIRTLSYVFCDDDFLWSINKEFLNHDMFTDIITFGYADRKRIDAEIYISAERVKENAEIFHTKMYAEILRVMVHGLLHCCGYSDNSVAQKKKMRTKEDFYLKKFPL